MRGCAPASSPEPRSNPVWTAAVLGPRREPGGSRTTTGSPARAFTSRRKPAATSSSAPTPSTAATPAPRSPRCRLSRSRPFPPPDQRRHPLSALLADHTTLRLGGPADQFLTRTDPAAWPDLAHRQERHNQDPPDTRTHDTAPIGCHLKWEWTHLRNTVGASCHHPHSVASHTASVTKSAGGQHAASVTARSREGLAVLAAGRLRDPQPVLPYDGRTAARQASTRTPEDRCRPSGRRRANG